jgi:hypothetical protein
LFAETDASVVTLSHDIGQAVFEDELDLNVRIFRKKRNQGRPEDRIGRVLSSRDAQGACGLLTQFAQRGKPGIDLVEQRTHGAEQAFAGLRRRDAAGSARQRLPDG